MADKAEHKDHRGAIQLLEEAVHLLRRAPDGALGCYFIGSMPFVMGAMYFWADMSRSALAAGRLGAASLTLGILFVWMKCWQSVFAAKLHAALCGNRQPRWTFSRIGRIVLSQATVQPWGLVVLPIAACVPVIWPWTYAFCQNACVLGDDRRRGVARVAWRQASLWPRQNIVASLVLSLFGLFVLVNIILAILLPPYLLKTFLGVETVFSRGGFNPANTTFLAIAVGLTYLCIDPIVKAFYTLRCFYGLSLASGEDLRAELRRAATPRRAHLVSVVLMVLFATFATPASAAGPRGGSVDSKKLDESLSRVISRPEYTWRMRRDTPPEQAAKGKEKSYIGAFFDKLRDWVNKLRRWLFEPRAQRNLERTDPSATSLMGWIDVVRIIVWILLTAAVGALLILAWIALRKWRKSPAVETATAAAGIDLKDDNIAADDLPEDEWLEMARELTARGQRRPALRAMYLASLASLAERGLISLARFKSNRDYQSELQRRAHSLNELNDAFGQNVALFEDAWYGTHEVTERIFSLFRTNQQRICFHCTRAATS